MEDNKGIKPRRILNIMVMIALAAILMLGSGFMGAHLARANAYTPVAMTPAPAPMPVMANGFELMREVLPAGYSFSLPDLFDGANPAVVAISIEVTGRNVFGAAVTRPASGSGFIISPDGYIVTNDHVIENANSITVLKYNGSEYPATVVGRDPNSDLAVIKIDAVGLPFLAFGNSDVIRVGEQVAAIGNPLGELANSMTVGHISALNRDVTIEGITHNKIQTDAAVNRGNSGGPLLNLQGEVIGVISAKSVGTGVEGLGFAIPSNHAQTVVSQLIQYGFVRGRAILGVSINTQPGADVQVVLVTNGSAADRAGIQVYDVILAANGVEVSRFADLRAILDGLSPGDAIELRVRRDNEELTVTAILDEFIPEGL